MIARHNTSDWFEVLHESSSPFRLITRPVASESFSSSWNSDSTCLMPLLGAESNTTRQYYSRLIAGNASVFDAVSVDNSLRLMSVPVMYNGRSVSLTRVRKSIDGTGAMHGPNYSLLSRLLERSSAAVCIIDPDSKTIVAFNRKFVELWNITSDCFQSWYGLEYSLLTQRAGAVGRASGDAATFLRLEGITDRCERVLPLLDGDAVRGVFDPVCVSRMSPFRVIASFSREEISFAHRRREFVAAFRRLTHRQTEVVQHVARGLTNSEIAQLLGVGVKTIEKHRGMAIAKLNVESVPELVRLVDFVHEADMSIH